MNVRHRRKLLANENLKDKGNQSNRKRNELEPIRINKQETRKEKCLFVRFIKRNIEENQSDASAISHSQYRYQS